MDQDVGKVLLFVNMTLEENEKMQTDEELQQLQRLLLKYQAPEEKNPQLAIYGQFTYDV